MSASSISFDMIASKSAKEYNPNFSISFIRFSVVLGINSSLSLNTELNFVFKYWFNVVELIEIFKFPFFVLSKVAFAIKSISFEILLNSLYYVAQIIKYIYFS